MSETKKVENRASVIVERFNELRGEFRKIVWPSREELLKKTITVIIMSLIFGAIIAVMDGFFGIVFTSFTSLFV